MKSFELWNLDTENYWELLTLQRETEAQGMTDAFYNACIPDFLINFII